MSRAVAAVWSATARLSQVTGRPVHGEHAAITSATAASSAVRPQIAAAPAPPRSPASTFSASCSSAQGTIRPTIASASILQPKYPLFDCPCWVTLGNGPRLFAANGHSSWDYSGPDVLPWSLSNIRSRRPRRLRDPCRMVSAVAGADNLTALGAQVAAVRDEHHVLDRSREGQDRMPPPTDVSRRRRAARLPALARVCREDDEGGPAVRPRGRRLPTCALFSRADGRLRLAWVEDRRTCLR